MKLRALLSSFAAVAVMACGVADRGSDDDAANSAIVGGVDARGESLDAIGTLGHKWGDSYDFFCTATLVAPNAVLTAKHCAQHGATEPPFIAEEEVYFAVGPDADKPREIVKAVSVLTSPLSEGGFIKYGSDVAVYMLETPITDVKPMKIATTVPGASDEGKTFMAIGYGVQDRARTVGTRKAGQVTLRATSGSPMQKMFETPEKYFAYVTEKEGADYVTRHQKDLQEFYDFKLLDGYEIYLGLGEGDAQPCSGDSGGPLVGSVNGENQVFAVVSGSFKGDTYPCSLLGESYAAFGPKARDVIEASIGPCQGVPIAGRCEGTKAVRCVADREGPQKVTRTDCAAIGNVCSTDANGNAACTDAPKPPSDAGTDGAATDAGTDAGDAGIDGAIEAGPVDAGPG